MINASPLPVTGVRVGSRVSVEVIVGLGVIVVVGDAMTAVAVADGIRPILSSSEGWIAVAGTSSAPVRAAFQSEYNQTSRTVEKSKKTVKNGEDLGSFAIAEIIL